MELHEKYVKSPKIFQESDKKQYQEALRTVIDHRELVAQVRLQNHVRVYRLLMLVWGRILSYIWLWERDLYFVSLALISSHGSEEESQSSGTRNYHGVQRRADCI